MLTLFRSSSFKTFLLILGVLFIATNLRGPMTAVAPLLDEIQRFFQLTSAETGMMTSLPLLVLAVVSPLCASIAFRFGLERTLFAGLTAIVIGIALRSSGSLTALFAGTALIGVGIAIGNVLLPGLLKRDFPNKLAVFTSGYALVMGIAAALMSAVAIPLSRYSTWGWQFALAGAGVFAVIAWLLWLPQVRATTKPLENTSSKTRTPVWRYALAWQVTLFMGINSFVYYTLISWLPAIVHDAGFSAERAGQLHGLMQLMSAFAGIFLIAVLHRMKDQRPLVVMAIATQLVGTLGLLFHPELALIWSGIFGLGNGATFILALSFIGLRAGNATQAASLSGLAQSFGYLFAAIGPSLMGVLHDATGTWTATLAVCAVLTLIAATFGLFAGRSIQLPH